ncbi:tRNA (adenosine(37)-N6)-threonylcarbamoyltransferase complex ATPase subunit type 1 TsaE [Agromyces sp. MMS24-JH15]|uniref:tRNA (adenosine(37)-N6)-threonylcarbamoyltransferase complex ATPase subunit type 1 TsaE n=1 Tax=Agromyces sp. MMS24-JH15 TaxID=3243765 RepID=UPI003748D730
MEELGRELGRMLRAGDLVVLTGPLGAGKTTLTRGIGDGLGIRGPVQSPTFVLARTHPSLVGGAPLVHVDAYRLGTATELFDLDLDFDRAVVVAEWGAGLIEDAADSRLEVVIERRSGGADAPSRGVADDPSGGAHDDALDDALYGAHDDAGDDAFEDALDDAGLDVDEPRVVTVAGVGPRWAGTEWAASA